MRVSALLIVTMLLASGTGLAYADPTQANRKPDFPKFEDVSKNYEKVVSTVDGKSFYTLYIDKKNQQVLAELPRGWERQKHYIAVTQAGGSPFAGLQGPARYVYWKRYGKRMALMEPELGTRSTGEPESKSSVKRLFTDTVLIDVPIVCMGPNGQPVIDLDDLLVSKSSAMMSGGRRGSSSSINSRLVEVKKAKAFPENIEIAFEAPGSGGQLRTVHYSISLIPDNTGYKPREADERIGYFTTVYRDLGSYVEDEKWVRYIDRWHLEKRDPSLRLSPPKEPIVFYLEHTVPVRYRRWVRQGVLYWNEAFRQIGIDNAIEVLIQDKATGKHMDKDPEDVRYNFIRWLNNDVSTAIGPHRSHPLTGQVLDADIIMTDGWIRAYWRWYHERMPQLAMQGMSQETLSWLADNPEWDPRLLLAGPEEREQFMRDDAHEDRMSHINDPLIAADADFAEISDWLGDEHKMCLAAEGLAFDMAVAGIALETTGLRAELTVEGEDPSLDGIPEWFVGPLLASLTCHEVGHTLGLRHNFKASSIYTLEQVNSEEWKGNKTLAGSVMDYLPANINIGGGEVQGDFAMIGVGPYDMWAIEYGYTFDDTDEVVARVAEPELVYLTDDDTSGPDPLARRYDFSAEPLDYGTGQLQLVEELRGRLLEEFVKDGDSWSNARRGYGVTLSLQLRALSMMANWMGGAHVNRDRKGDPGSRAPIEVVSGDRQRDALEFLIVNTFPDDAYGLSPEMLRHMTVDKWSDSSPGDRGDSTWDVHDRISGIQSSVLTMILNPTTLRRIYDNEQTTHDENALTLPELLDAIMAAVYIELDEEPDGAYSNRNPMISSMRRNLQSLTVDRLIALGDDDRRMPRPVRTLALHHLRQLDQMLEDRLEANGDLDIYTQAHLEDMHERISRALDTVYITQ
jgi:hypothetical protein